MEPRITRAQVKELYGIASDATLWRWIQQGLFPEPIRVNSRSIYWTREQLEAWEATRRSDAANKSASA